MRTMDEHDREALRDLLARHGVREVTRALADLCEALAREAGGDARALWAGAAGRLATAAEFRATSSPSRAS